MTILASGFLRGIDNREWSGGGRGGPVVVLVVIVDEEVVSVLNVVVQTVVGSPVDVVAVDAERTPRPLVVIVVVVVVREASRHLCLRPRRLLLAGAGLPGPRHRVAAELRLEAQEVLLELRLANERRVLWSRD